jgi:translation elongation factor EF-1alpha
MPSKTETEILSIKLHHLSVEIAEAGENIQLYIKNLSDFSAGSIVCGINKIKF